MILGIEHVHVGLGIGYQGPRAIEQSQAGTGLTPSFERLTVTRETLAPMIAELSNQRIPLRGRNPCRRTVQLSG